MQTPAISKHLKNIFEEKELDECAIISKMETIQLEGNRQITRLYVKPVYFLYFELFEISEQLPQMGNVIILNITISTGLFPVVID